jgi:Protein of unknown function (DUF2911)/Tetratricopeptide repeat
MKKFVLLSLLSGAMYFSEAQPLKMPSPSTTQSIKQEFALTSVELSYSRPNMKGRKIFGDLVPYNAVWRTGANSATTISFADEVIIGDKKVPAGKYGLLTMPGASEWTVIITKQLDVTSPAAYKADQDVVRVTAKVDALPFSMETFTITFDNVTATTMDLWIAWEKTAVSVPIKMEVDAKVMAQIDNAMNKDNKPYFQSAMYYMESGKDLAKANMWFDKAIEQNPTAFWIYYNKANCLAKMGKKSEAIATSNKSIELATAAKNDDYIALNKKLQAGLK